MPSSDDQLARKHLSRGTKIKLAVTIIVAAAIALYLIFDVVFHGPLTSLLVNRDQLVQSVESWGAFAPLLYMLLQIMQTVVAPIPGQVVGSVGGFLFGTWGIVWTAIGTLIGCYIVFRLARRFGRPLLEKIFKPSVIEQFDFILSSKSTSLILFAIFLLPGFPDDMICYLAGMTPLSIRRLMVILILGKLPTIILTNFLGAGLSDNLGLVAGLSVIMVMLLGLAIWKREFIMRILKGEYRKEQKKPKQKS